MSKDMNQHFDDGGPAFPMPSGPEPRVNSATHYNEGMSLRDHFAAKALSAILQVDETSNPDRRLSKGRYADITARDAYAFADAMIAARKGGA